MRLCASLVEPSSYGFVQLTRSNSKLLQVLIVGHVTDDMFFQTLGDILAIPLGKLYNDLLDIDGSVGLI